MARDPVLNARAPSPFAKVGWLVCALISSACFSDRELPETLVQNQSGGGRSGSAPRGGSSGAGRGGHGGAGAAGHSDGGAGAGVQPPGSPAAGGGGTRSTRNQAGSGGQALGGDGGAGGEEAVAAGSGGTNTSPAAGSGGAQNPSGMSAAGTGSAGGNAAGANAAGRSGAGAGGGAGRGGAGGSIDGGDCFEWKTVADLKQTEEVLGDGSWIAGEENLPPPGVSVRQYICLGAPGTQSLSVGKAAYRYGCYVPRGSGPWKDTTDIQILVAPNPNCLGWGPLANGQLPNNAQRLGTESDNVPVCQAAWRAPNPDGLQSEGLHVGQVIEDGETYKCRFEFYDTLQTAADFKVLVRLPP